MGKALRIHPIASSTLVESPATTSNSSSSEKFLNFGTFTGWLVCKPNKDPYPFDTVVLLVHVVNRRKVWRA